NYLAYTYKSSGKVHLYDIQQNTAVELAEVSHTFQFYLQYLIAYVFLKTKAQWCSFSLSGKLLAISNKDGYCNIWDTKFGKITHNFNSVDSSSIECICWSQDSYLACGTISGNVFLYNTVTKQLFAAFTHKQGTTDKLSAITSIKWSPHKDLIATTSTNGILSLWNYRLKECIIKITTHKAPATDLVFSPTHDSFMVVSGMDTSVACIDVQTQKLLSSIPLNAPLTSVDFHREGSIIACGTLGHGTYILDLRDMRKIMNTLVNDQHKNVYAVKSKTTTPVLDTTAQQQEKNLSTFGSLAQKRTRHTSSSSVSTPTTETAPTLPVQRTTQHYATQPRATRSTSQIYRNGGSISNANSSTINDTQDGRAKNTEKIQPNHLNESSSISKSNSTISIKNSSMNFSDFLQICGVSSGPQQVTNGHCMSSTDTVTPTMVTIGNNDEQHDLRQLLEKYANDIKEEMREEIEKQKLANQTFYFVELQKLRYEMRDLFESYSLNQELVDELERLRAENKRLRKLQPK
ncbi:unnamed protein product, partial [Didymodactylos carnosus]